MGLSYFAVHIQTEQLKKTADLIGNWMSSIYPEAEIVRTESAEFALEPQENNSDVEDALPTCFTIGLAEDGWIYAHYNSTQELRELAIHLSRELACLVVVVMAVRINDAYYICVCREGSHLRTLYSGEGEWYKLVGDPLPFETEHLGSNISDDDEEPEYMFDEEAAIEYCSNLGLELFWEEVPEEWISIQVKK